MFSDSHLAEDGFLLKHVQKNRQGYVSLKLLTSWKKIKAVTTNWHMILAAAVKSDLLELNTECTKVRRKQPLPKWLQRSPTTRLLLAWNITEGQRGEREAAQGLGHAALSERILQRFKVHGDVSSVWILHPGEELPKQLQCYAKNHKELGLYLCAVVKFDSLEATRQAWNALGAEDQSRDEKDMCLVPLGFWQKHQIINNQPSEDQNNNQSGEGTSPKENPIGGSGVVIQPEVDHCRRTLGNFLPQAGDFQPVNHKTKCCPWVLMHKFEATVLKAKMAAHPTVRSSILRVLRQPFGPDGTRGFRGRGMPLQPKVFNSLG
uniref:La-related protein 6-like n=2 Tax=Salarias fasciatus TaxID=181472 RepID=A0A672HHV1_SALFA